MSKSIRFLQIFSLYSVVLGLGSFLSPAVAQEAKTAEEKAPAPLPSTRTLPETYPVITIKGDCPKGAKPAGGCNIVVTREEFEDLINSINPRMTTFERRDLAKNYGQMLALSQEALRDGLDKKPGVKALMRYVRTSALGGAEYKQLLREHSNPSDAALEKYFAANQGMFQRYTFQRLFVPMEKQGQMVSLEDVAKNDAKVESTAAAMKQLADEMHKRAAAGEDFVALQKEIGPKAGITQPVDVNMPDMVPGTLPQDHETAFKLADGAVSPVITDGSGHYIYKLVSKKTPTLEDQKPQISLTMQNEQMSAELKKIEGRSQVNADYFDKYQPPEPDPNAAEVEDD